MTNLLWFDIMNLENDDPDWSNLDGTDRSIDDADTEDYEDLIDLRAAYGPEKIDNTNSQLLRRIVYNQDGSVKEIHYHRYVL